MSQATEQIARQFAQAAINKKNWGSIIFNIEAYRISGETSDSGAFSRAISDIKAAGGGTLLLPEVGPYVINSTLLVENVEHLTINSYAGAVITTNTIGLDYMFSFKDCDDIKMEGITFDSNYTGKSQIKMERTSRPKFIRCNFQNFREDASDMVYDPDNYNSYFSHAVNLGDSPYGQFEWCNFSNIGGNFGGSMESNTQYRAITAGGGCGRVKVRYCSFTSVFQSIVVAEFDYWRSGTAYTSGARVINQEGGGINRYRCVLNHTSDGTNAPPNATYWKLEKEVVIPTSDLEFSDNYCYNIRDNAVYFLEYVDNLKCHRNEFVRSHDEPIVVVGRNADIVANHFIDTGNKAIAIGTVDNIEKLNIINNTFRNTDDEYTGAFVVYRDTAMTYKVKKLVIQGNVFEAISYVANSNYLLLGKADVLLIQNNTFDMNVVDFEIMLRLKNTISKGIISGNTFMGKTASAQAFQDDSVGSNILWTGNNQVNCRGSGNQAGMAMQNVRLTLTAGNSYFTDNPGKWGWGAQAPLAGGWNRGDIVWNLGASASGKAGWICVVAGTPGTWKTFATIDA